MALQDQKPISRNNNISGVNKSNAHRLDNSIKLEIENNLYHIFKDLEEERSIKIVDILNRLNLEKLQDGRYRQIKYSYEGLVKSIILMELKGFKFQIQLEAYLSVHKKEARELGFAKIPDRRTISHFLNNVLDSEAKEITKFTVQKIEEIADKFGIVLDREEIKAEKPERKIASTTFYRKKDKKTKELCKLFRKKIAPFIELHMGTNCVYEKKEFLDLLVHLGLTKDFAENGSKTFKQQRKHGPDGDTLLYHLKKYEDIRDLQRKFEVIFEMIWQMARKAHLFHNKVDIAIDYTDWFFYGDKNAPMVMRKKPERGTDCCYRFATVNIVQAEKRFTILALPKGPLDRNEDILRRLLEYTRKRVKIRKVYADRAFFTGECIKIFQKLNCKFLMPCTSNPRIKELMRIMPAPSVVRDYHMTGATFNVVIVENEGIKWAFASNEDWNENDLNLSKRLAALYSKRWGIETSYRVKKHSFRAKTTSKNYFVRFFYFLFSVLLYNLWILLDIFLCLTLFGKKTQDHIITSKLFGTIFYTTKDG